jgi:tetratricopeptide (TPR) repeat protein
VGAEISAALVAFVSQIALQGEALRAGALTASSVAPNGAAQRKASARTNGANESPDEVDIAELLEREVRPALAPALIEEDAKAYGRVRWRVRTGFAPLALKELESIDSRLFADRFALVRAQAFEQRRDFAHAEDAYVDALSASSAPQVSEQAARGLVSIAGKRGDWQAQLRFLDAIIGQVDQPDASLDLMRASALAKIGRREDAKRQLWAILDVYPSQKAVDEAEKLLLSIERRRRLSGSERVHAEMGRARYFVRTARWQRALQSFGQIKAWAPRMSASIDLEIADVQRLRGAKSLAEATLLKLSTLRHIGNLRAEVLLRLGRLADERYQYPRARALFGELAEKYPGTPAAVTGAFDAARLEYDANQFEVASAKMLAIAADEKHPELIPQALWMGGWCAYLSGSSTTAAYAFERLLQVDADPEAHEAAAYWLARTNEQMLDSKRALDRYRALALQAPLRYYGLLARSRLEALGSPMAASPPREIAPPATVDELIAMLGPNRPLNIDRAIALFRAGYRGDGVEELLVATDYYRRRDDRLGMTLSIDLFRMFEREAWASLLSRNIAEESRAQPDREPHFWRVWRTAYPTPFQEEVDRASRDHTVDPFLAYAVIRTESRFRPDAVSPVGARGLMQLMPATARWIGRMTARARQYVGRYRAPGPNIWLGAWYVKNLVERYRGNLVQALGAYNAGPGAMDRWVRRFGDLEMDEFAERTPYFETRLYIRRTLENYMIYHELYDPPFIVDLSSGARGSKLKTQDDAAG